MKDAMKDLTKLREYITELKLMIVLGNRAKFELAAVYGTYKAIIDIYEREGSL